MNLTNSSKTMQATIVVFLYITFALLASHIAGFEFDFFCFKNWATHIFTNGLPHAYTAWNNYTPFYQYVLWLYGKIAGSTQAIASGIFYLKAFTLLFDIWGLWIVYKWIEDKTDFLLLLLFNMLNFAYIYNTVIWGQMDGIHTAMVVASLYYGYKRKAVLSVIWYVLALNMKLQAIIFLPVLALMLLHNIKGNWKMTLLAITAGVGVQWALLAPFLSVPNGFQLFYDNVIKGATTIHPYLVSGAFNIWHLIYADPTTITDDKVFLLGMNYKKVGFILFALSSLVAMLPLIISVIRNTFQQKLTGINREQLWIACSLIALNFFFFNTEMHERYCHPAFLFTVAYTFSTKDFIPYILFSVMYFLHLEKVMKLLNLDNYNTFIFDPRLIAGLCLVLMGYLFFRLYTFNKKAPVQEPLEKEFTTRIASY